MRRMDPYNTSYHGTDLCQHMADSNWRNHRKWLYPVRNRYSAADRPDIYGCSRHIDDTGIQWIESDKAQSIGTQVGGSGEPGISSVLRLVQTAIVSGHVGDVGVSGMKRKGSLAAAAGGIEPVPSWAGLRSLHRGHRRRGRRFGRYCALGWCFECHSALDRWHGSRRRWGSSLRTRLRRLYR